MDTPTVITSPQRIEVSGRRKFGTLDHFFVTGSTLRGPGTLVLGQRRTTSTGTPVDLREDQGSLRSRGSGVWVKGPSRDGQREDPYMCPRGDLRRSLIHSLSPYLSYNPVQFYVVSTFCRFTGPTLSWVLTHRTTRRGIGV